MASGQLAYLAFNRGLVSALALARIDVKRLALSAETMVNWITRVMGSMMLRPGWGYLGTTRNNLAARNIPFIFSTSAKAKLELTNSQLRIWIDDVLLARPAVSTVVTNGDFDTNLTGWTQNDEAGATSAWGAGGIMALTGNGSAAAIRDQQVTVAAADQNIEHGLHIVVTRGTVTLRVGSTSGGDEYISETELGTGAHHLALTPTGNFYIRFLSRLKRQVRINSCNIEEGENVVISTPWADDDLDFVRYDQSADVIFVSCDGHQQRRIERRAARSWSVVTYQPEDGPFMVGNVGPITITPSGTSGNITLTASAALFKSTNVGSLFRVTPDGQLVSASVVAQNTFTSPIRITGVGDDRAFSISIANVWVGTVQLQRSFTSDAGPWTDVTGESWVANTTTSYNDGLDNQIAWYRIGIKTGAYTSGTADVALQTSLGSITGYCRVTGYTSSTVVSAEVFSDIGGATATTDWAEGKWSDRRGWPTAVVLDEGRLWWFGRDAAIGSVSDAYDSFDDTIEGDSGPISRTIGSGPVDTINWAIALQRLLLGGQGAEFSVRSSSLDEPLTPTNFNMKRASTQGSAAVQALVANAMGIYVQRGGTRVYGLEWDGNAYDYTSTHLSALIPSIGKPRIVRAAVQMQPDVRVHFVRSDGTVAMLVFDKVENVLCWLEIETADGDLVEDVMVLPGGDGDDEDEVHYIVARQVNGSTKRYHEKWALESECAGGTLNKQADAFVIYEGAATTTITGLDHLEGRTVVVWGDGIYLGTYVVSGGQITGLTQAVSSAIAGLGYTAQWQSAKLAFAAALGMSLSMMKVIKGLGLVLSNTHATGLRYGPSFDVMQDLPGIEGGKPVGVNEIRAAYDEETFEFPGEWMTDARLCLQAVAPKPCTVMAAICDGEAG